jgi:serine/threonine protein phosphatase PrpC
MDDGDVCDCDREPAPSALASVIVTPGRILYTRRMAAPETAVSTAFRASGATDVGRKRDHNEDDVLVRADLHLYLVADGAGGHNAGEVASAIATRSIASFFESTRQAYRGKPDIDEFGLWTGARRLGMAVQRANRDVIEVAASSNKRRGMGTTIVAAAISPRSNVIHVAHVGDSRCYRVRNGHIEQMTQDHSLIADALELRPDIDDATLARLPSNVITRALGMDDAVRVPVRTYGILNGDRYLLCTDGLSNALTPADLSDAICRDVAPDETVRHLIDMANAAGGDDNIAAVVIVCDSVPERPRSFHPSNIPAPRRQAQSPGSTTEESVPEIMLLGIEEIDLDTLGGLRVLPKESASEGLFAAVRDLMAPVREQFARRRRSDRPSVPCPKCGAPIDRELCPLCGTRRPGA